MAEVTIASRAERILEGFEPNFEFQPAPPIPPSEFNSRIERLRRAATVAGHDVLLINANGAPRFSTSNDFLRYACDWQREGVLIIPTDPERGLHLLSFFTESVILPPAGEPIGVEAIWQIGPVTREYSGRSGNPETKLAEACVKLLHDLRCEAGSVGVIGDASSSWLWTRLKADLPRARLED